MSVRKILKTFDAWRARGEPLVLATVYDTLGSTYTKAGHRIIIAANGDYRGLVSGGCLEGDLAERARIVATSGTPAAVTYDLRDEADEIFGLGVGCNGLLRVFLQPLLPEAAYEPFATIARGLLSRTPAALAMVVESTSASLPIGATVVAEGEAVAVFGATVVGAERLLLAHARHALVEGSATLVADGGAKLLRAPLRPLPQLLVLGAGLDAQPLVRMAAELGWLVTVADHRPAYLERDGLEAAERKVLVNPAALASDLPVADFDAIVVMTHHLPTDRQYLAQLDASTAAYLGVLGPRARRDRLVEELATVAPQLRERLRGPVGLDIGADSPESIALSILAELQLALRSAHGRPQ